MAFGRELQDFVSAFQGGYNLIKSPEEKQREREKWQMEKDKFSRDGTWHDEATERDKRDFDYKAGRDETHDKQWQKQFDFNQSKDTYDRGRDDVRDNQFTRQQDNLERNQGIQMEQDIENRRLKEEELRLKRRELGVKAREENREPANLQEWLGDRDGAQTDDTTPQPQSYNDTGAIPEGYQNAAFTPAQDTSTGFNLRSYLASIRSNESGGNDNAKNPKSTASGRYQAISSTWRSYMNRYPELGLTPDGRFDGDQQERFIKRFTYDNGTALDNAGVPVNNGTMYAAHFLGSDGAIKALRSSNNTPMSEVVSSKVIKANPFLRNMSVGTFKRWAARKANSHTAEDYSVGAASGGLITAIPEDENDQRKMAEDALMQHNLTMPDDEQAEGVIPDDEQAEGEQEVIPTDRKPAYDGVSEGDKEEPTDDPFELGRRAVRDGMKRTIKDLGISDEETAIDERDIEQAYDNYVKGYGAAPDQVMRQVMTTIDPDKKMSPAERNFKSMGMVYQYYMDQGKPEEAQKAASSMVQYYRQMSQKFLAISQSAAEEGDIDDAAQAAMAAYANIPNGRDLKINKKEDGSYEVSVTDSKSGKQVTKTVLSPQELAAAAMNFSPKTFDDEILNAAGIKGEDIEGTPDVKIERTKGENNTTIQDGVKQAAEEMWPEDGDVKMDAKLRNNLIDAAGQIATITNNAMGADEALRFVDVNDSTPFDKPRELHNNPGMVALTRGGKTAIVRKADANNILRAWSDKVKADAKQVDDAKTDAKESADNLEWYKKKGGELWDQASKNLDEASDGPATKALKWLSKTTSGAIPENMPDASTDEGRKNMPVADKALADARDAILASGDIEAQREELDEIEDILIQSGYIKERTPKKAP